MAFVLLAGGNNDVETTAFIFDSLVNIEENYSNEVTRHPVETGSNISDHIFTRNPTFRLQGIVQNNQLNQPTGNGSPNNIINQKPDRIANAREQLLALRDTKATFTLVMKYETITNCVITNLTFPREANNSSVLTANISIEKVRFVSSQTVQIINADPSIADSAKNTTSTGGDNKKESEEYELEIWKTIKGLLTGLFS